MTTKKTPNATDLKIGGLIRARRLQLVMSQEKLAEHIGVSFQQIQKYEKGTNRVGGSRMAEIAAALGCTVAALHGETDTIERIAGLDKIDLEIARAASALSPAARHSVLSIIQSLTSAGALKQALARVA